MGICLKHCYSRLPEIPGQHGQQYTAKEGEDEEDNDSCLSCGPALVLHGDGLSSFTVTFTGFFCRNQD